ncbi:MAG TPA: class I SAM-dependent methyltransferase [Blastocatellia bacterium]|nr:class I SAM-dependent methyltransferase [Blastocatellia bacterium]
MTGLSYVGSELEIFSRASNWKAYYGRIIRRHLAGDVLEVGAGIGATTRSLCDGSQRRWVCLEPDLGMLSRLKDEMRDGHLPPCCEAASGVIKDLGAGELFDAILYIDVLEHIEADGEEVRAAAAHLKPSGKLIVLAPAHQWLYTPFDKAIGHFRRYNKRSLTSIIPEDLECIELRYLDSVGLIASLGNKLILKSSMPTDRQIALWDRVMIPASRLIDPLSGYRVGKSVLGVWRKKPLT